jgi:hypothetical protein
MGDLADAAAAASFCCSTQGRLRSPDFATTNRCQPIGFDLKTNCSDQAETIRINDHRNMRKGKVKAGNYGKGEDCSY